MMKKLQLLTEKYINLTFHYLGMVKRPQSTSSWRSRESVINVTNIVRNKHVS